MSIRQLTAADYTSYKILINDFRETYFTEEQFIQFVNQLHPFNEIWVIEKDGELIATGTIIFEQKLIHNMGILSHIEDICVIKGLRSHGFGKQIVEHLILRSRERGAYKITLDCNEVNEQFYIKCGLEKRGVQMSQLTPH
jgi:glucosamine-phosphate N-acetyltransferase